MRAPGALQRLARRVALILTIATGSPAGCTASTLPELEIDVAAITVSGLSSGGFMAVQIHVARSSLFSGAGVVAGGPYACALGSIWPALVTATTICMDIEGDFIPFAGPPSVDASVRATRDAWAMDAIDDPGNMRDDRVYLFSGARDNTVPTSVMDAVEDYYLEFVDADGISYQNSIDAGHGFATMEEGVACSMTASPYLNDCNYDTAGEILDHLYGGSLSAPRNRYREDGLIEFDQAPFTPPGFSPRDVSLADQGFIYVPEDCADGARCALHVALHGCRQHAGAVGRAFVEGAGFNAWAEANDIVVLYPQARAVDAIRPDRTNPRGCWDWWGYTGNGFHLRAAPQISTIAAMVESLAGSGEQR
ncbi:MAG: hypothetical protein DWQ08_12400 [Proteobacteria bacterium]|nr:MAG: hypothetical protein DWQ08_12400 [Pseudomonadota bacterium]